jgi:hypothetical protein
VDPFGRYSQAEVGREVVEDRKKEMSQEEDEVSKEGS